MQSKHAFSHTESCPTFPHNHTDQCAEEAAHKDISSVSEALGRNHIYEAIFQHICVYIYLLGVVFFFYFLN